MKKLLHLVVASAFLVFVSSCSKSAGDLAVSENNSSSNLMKKTRDFGSVASEFTWTKFYPAITEPKEMNLGEPGASLLVGDMPVFYVVLSPELREPITSAALDAYDAVTGEILQRVEMLPDSDPEVATLIVPDELWQHSFMFARVKLDDQFLGRTISLRSVIQKDNGEISYAGVATAFTVDQ